MEIKLQPYQAQYLNATERFPALVGGIGTGKTFMLLLKVWRFVETWPGSRALITRNEYTDLHDSTIKDFERYFNVKVGVDKEYELPNKSVIMFRHGSELNTLKNITLDIAAIEQAEEFLDETQFTFIRDRLRGKAGPYQQLCIIANANGHNWIWKMWVNDLRPEYKLVLANSFENECNLPEGFVADLRRMQVEAPHHYAQYVMNSFEEMDQDDFVFNFAELTEAKKREYSRPAGYNHRIMGYDIARYGNDKCAAVGIEQIGALAWKTFHVEQWEHHDLNYTTGRIIAMSAQHAINDNIIDEDGIGGGPLDFITKGRMRDDFQGFRNKNLPFDSNPFYGNPRTAAAFKAREYISKGWIAIPNEDLIQELMTLRYKFTNDGRRILVSKEEMRKIGVKSPNMADAFLMAVSLIGEVHDRQENLYVPSRQTSYKESNLFSLAGIK